MAVDLHALSFAVSPITERDESDWLAMRRSLWPGHAADEHRKEMRALAAARGFAGFLARDGAGAAVGFAEVFVRPFVNGCASRPVPFLEGIWVAEAERGHGVGRRLLLAVEDWCRSHGFAELGSDALIDNEGSHRAHAAWGFAETERVVYFRKPLPETEPA
jgi:aminoglycoside 6'-N-acetyltransferase I